jgi:hypothetical protein
MKNEKLKEEKESNEKDYTVVESNSANPMINAGTEKSKLGIS